MRDKCSEKKEADTQNSKENPIYSGVNEVNKWNMSLSDLNIDLVPLTHRNEI